MKHYATKTATVAVLAALTWNGVAAAQSPVITKHFSFYEKNSSLVYTAPNGKIATLPVDGPPAPGSQIEFTDLDYSGTLAHHSNPWSGSDHFACAFAADGKPTCSGQLAIDGSMLIAQGPGGQGTFSIPVVSGTGSFLGYRGTLDVSDISTTLNANLVVVISKQ